VYATQAASSVVTDIILDSIQIRDVTLLYVYVPMVISIVIALLCIIEPRRIPFLLKTVALFTLIRSVFISLTHLGIPPLFLHVSPDLMAKFNFGGDLFFSGHTGMPYLMCLIFWHRTYLRIFFFSMALFLGTVVLIGHLHYSIDVLSAFFITYSIFHISEVIFAGDYHLSIEETHS
jgi:hypothetical protein